MTDWTKTNASDQWDQIHKVHFTDDALGDLSNFKSNSLNHKLAIWNPNTNGVRYLKELIFNLCYNLSSAEWKLLENIKGREVGKPYSVIFNGHHVCLDYLQAVLEINAITPYLSLDETNVLEIGAGYGRTCHAILSNYRLSSYTIVDLKKSLALSMAYLKEVLPIDRFNSIQFVTAEDLKCLVGENYTLALNIDSFSEMPEQTVYTYLRFIRMHCHWCYIKNPVGKYIDPSLDRHSEGIEAVGLALSSGILRDTIDIHNNQAVKRQSIKFLSTYSPGKEWELISDSWARPWSYYWQAIYRKIGFNHAKCQ